MTNRRNGFSSAGNDPPRRKYTGIQNTARKKMRMALAGATIVLPMTFESKGRLVIGSDSTANPMASFEPNSTKRRKPGLMSFIAVSQGGAPVQG